MSVPLDLITQRNLILVKQIYQRAVVQSASHHSDVDRILSLISFDLANETLLKNAITAVDSRAKIISELNELIKTADEVFRNAVPPIPPVPDAQKIRRVRKIRNAAMHDATYPTAADINDCRTYTRDFLQQLVANVWGQDFIAIKLTDAVRHAEVKKFLVDAERHLEVGKPTDAVIQAKAAMQIALGRAGAAIVGALPRNVDSLAVYKEREAKPSREMLEAFKSMRDTLALSMIGLDYAGHRRYERITQFVFIGYYGDGKIDAAISGAAPDAGDAEFVVNFVINAVLQIESLVGDINNPFGENRRWKG